MAKTRKATDKGTPAPKKQKTKEAPGAIDFSTFSPEQLLAFAHALNSHVETQRDTTATLPADSPRPQSTANPTTPSEWPGSPIANEDPGVFAGLPPYPADEAEGDGDVSAQGGGNTTSTEADDADDDSPFRGLSHVSDQVKERLPPFVTKNEVANKRFSLSEIPPNVKWGTKYGVERFLCLGGVPIVVWILMRVKRSGFYDSEGNPLPRIYIGGALPHPPDDEAVSRLLALGEDDAGGAPDVIFAGKYMGKHKKDSTKSVAEPFERVYDASERFRSKQDMDVLRPTSIGLGDLVLVEANVARYNTDKMKNWKKFKVSFELISVALLFSAPRDYRDPDDVETAVANIDDDL